MTESQFNKMLTEVISSYKIMNDFYTLPYVFLFL